jgi:medium-chain acyl-[acyl-carrier-protein] hydrolase
MADSRQLWFEHMPGFNEPALRLFCFPYAGGSADIYRGWRKHFPKQIDICLVHLPGRGRRTRERAFTRLDEIVNAIVERIITETEIRYAFYGHSMGALISFELGRHMFRTHGVGPEHLFVSGHRAPQCLRTEPTIFNLPDEEFIAKLESLNGTPREALENRELMDVFGAILRADFEAVETYEYFPSEPLPCPISVYGGLQDKHVPVESCRAWQQQTLARCNVKMLPGDHFFIRNPESGFLSALSEDVLNAIPDSRTQEV